MAKKKVLFIYPHLSSFIKNDHLMMSKFFDVTGFHFKLKPKWLLPFQLVRQFFFILFSIHKTDVIITSFGGYHSFFPSLFGKVFRKKNFIIVHGTDCTAIEAYQYGLFRKKFLAWFLRSSYKNASTILPVSESLIYTKNTYDKAVGEQGIKFFVRHFRTPFRVIANGCLIEDWERRSDITRNERSFMTVVSGDGQFFIKGIDLIFEVAGKFPEYKFTIVGLGKTYPQKSDNVTILPFVSRQELVRLYSENQFYLQLSVSEGFGMSLCESMLCEMIPIGSDVNFIPTIIGDTGFVLKEKNVDLLSDLISKVCLIENKEEYGKRSRRRIIDNFSLEIRGEKIVRLLSEGE